jgi:hypothetical protein
MKHVLVLAVILSAGSGCAWQLDAGPIPPQPPAAPPPGPPSAGPMSYDEAVQMGAGYAQSRGFAYRLKKAELDHGRVWKVRMQVRSQSSHGELKLAYDAYSRALIGADEKLKSWGGHHDDDDDDDDDEHGRHGHGKHHDD